MCKDLLLQCPQLKSEEAIGSSQLTFQIIRLWALCLIKLGNPDVSLLKKQLKSFRNKDKLNESI